MALGVGSSALDSGTPRYTVDNENYIPNFDARGITREGQGTNFDIGAYEKEQ